MNPRQHVEEPKLKTKTKALNLNPKTLQILILKTPKKTKALNLILNPAVETQASPYCKGDSGHWHWPGRSLRLWSFALYPNLEGFFGFRGLGLGFRVLVGFRV